MARPKADISAEQVQELASFGLTNTEIAHFFGVAESTIRARFREILTKGRSALKTKLRRKQIEVALEGNVAMLIWLGKQYLGQSDKSESIQSVNQTVFSYGGAVVGITRRSKRDSGAPSTDQGGSDGAQVGEVLHGGGNVFDGS